MGADRRRVSVVAEPAAATPAADPSAAPAAEAIAIEEVRKRFGSFTALDGCSLHVRRGEFISLLGPSGCGKTTLLRIIGGFETQDSGTVRIHGERVDQLPPNKRNVNTVFQSYALFPHKTVFENIAFPLVIARVPKRERTERVREALELVQLRGVEERKATQLSGGQSQRVALARALVGRPEVLLLDEPLAALDLKLRKSMQLELRRIQETLGTTFVYVTHDQEEALTMSDRIVLMNGGRIVQGGSPREVYDEPANVFVSDFVGEANLLDGVVGGRDGDLVRVDAGGVELKVAPTAATPAAGPAVVSIRPERIELRRAGEEAGAARENRLDGTLERIVFLGNLVRCHVRVGELVLTAELPRERAEAVAEGEPVLACFGAADTRVLPPDGAPT